MAKAHHNAALLCEVCNHHMALADSNRVDHIPGQTISWRVKCTNTNCERFGIVYEAQPSVELREVSNG